MTTTALRTDHSSTGWSRRSWLLHVFCGGSLAGWGISYAKGVPRFRFVHADNLPPLSYLEKGTLLGRTPRLIHALLNQRLQLNVTHHAYPWARAQSLVQHGEADAFVAAATPERLQYVIPTRESLIQARLGAFVSTRNPRLAALEKTTSITDLAPLRLGSILGNNWAQSVLATYKVNYSATREAAFRMLQVGRIDMLIDVDEPTALAVSQAGLASEIRMLPFVLATEEVKICIGKHSALLTHLSDIDEAIRGMRKDGSLARLHKP